MSDAKAVFEELEKKEALIEQIKENNERVLCEKNQEINRLQLGIFLMICIFYCLFF